MILTETYWHAVYTKHQHEKSVARSLTQRNLETLLPLYPQMHKWKDRNQLILSPVFPCYVFVRANLERKAEILRTPGVCWLVGNGGYASRIPPEDLEVVRAVANATHAEPHPFLQAGDRVRVHSGPLSGVEGILIRLRNQFRLILSVQLLNQSAAVEVDLDNVERISPDSEAAAAPPRLLGVRHRFSEKEAIG